MGDGVRLISHVTLQSADKKVINTCESIHIFTWSTLRLNTWLLLLIEQMCLTWNLSVRADQTRLSAATEVNEPDSSHLDSNVALARCWSLNVPHIPLIRGIVGRFRESVSWTENRRSQLKKNSKDRKRGRKEMPLVLWCNTVYNP